MRRLVPQIIEKIVDSLERRISAVNKEREGEGMPPLPRYTITLLGQMALLVQSKPGALDLRMTRDLDVQLEGDWMLRTVLKDALAEVNLEYDDLSSEIWMPEEMRKEILHDSPVLCVKVCDAISILVSKGVKAPEKNRLLIRQAMLVYGEQLIALLAKYGAPLEYFVSDEDEK